MATTDKPTPTPAELAAFALSFGDGPTRDQQQQIAAHYGGFLPTYDTDDFLVAWPRFLGGADGNKDYATRLPAGELPSQDALSVTAGYMTQAQFDLPANIGIIRTPADAKPLVPPAGQEITKVINGVTYVFNYGAWRKKG